MSDFGERIYELRNKNNMSQGDLADKLNVSRQTISKWENCICMPETEKLIQLSEIFAVSTDYILKGEKEQNKDVYIYVKEDYDKPAQNHSEQITRKYVGIILAIVFALITIFLLIMGGSILAIMPGAVTVLGVLLAKNVKHPWLITGWITYIVSVVSLPFFTTFSPLVIFDPVTYTKDYIVLLLVGYSLWLIPALLIIYTIKTKRKKQSDK